jgi:hypothetical protein
MSICLSLFTLEDGFSLLEKCARSLLRVFTLSNGFRNQLFDPQSLFEWHVEATPDCRFRRAHGKRPIARDELCGLQGFTLQRLWRDHPRYEAEALGFSGIDPAAGHDQVEGALGANKPWKSLGPARARDDSARHFG